MTQTRKLIAAMKISVDGKVAPADWVTAWSDDYGLMSQIDACVLGAGMYPEYEQYWTAIQNEPDKPILSDAPPTAAEIEWAHFCARTPHYVLSSTLTSALWPKTRFLRGLDELAALKRQPGKDIYLVGGARTTGSLIEAGLVDELRLIVYPLIAGDGIALFATARRRRGLQLQQAAQLTDGRMSLAYTIG
jgi:dihydrofolate reductase